MSPHPCLAPERSKHACACKHAGYEEELSSDPLGPLRPHALRHLTACVHGDTVSSWRFCRHLFGHSGPSALTVHQSER